MYLYWAFFSYLTIFSLVNIKLEHNEKHILKIIFLFLLTLFIGLRHKVGGDWEIYLFDYKNNIQYFNLFNLNFVRDFGYELFSYFFYKLGIGIYGLNLFLAVIFIYSLNKFAIYLRGNYWLIFLIAFPYLVVVVAMGYSRQAAAFAIILLSMISISDKKIYQFLLLSLIAIIFHKSSAIMTFLIFTSYFKFSFKNLFIILLFCLFAYLIIFPEYNRITSGYLNEFSKYKSPGVKLRILINIIPSLLFIIFYKKIRFKSNLDLLIILSSIVNFGLFFFINDYSTFVDRTIIYFAFIQLIVFSRLYLIMPNFKILVNTLVVLFYFLIFFIWINFSNHSYAWVPYQNLIFTYIE